MKLRGFLLLAAIALLATPAYAVVDMYVEVGTAAIFLLRHCSPDGVRECNCAIADSEIAKTLDESVLCWTVEGDKIIFENHKFRFEKNLSDVKTLITAEPSGASLPRRDTTDPASLE